MRGPHWPWNTLHSSTASYLNCLISVGRHVTLWVDTLSQTYWVYLWLPRMKGNSSFGERTVGMGICSQGWPIQMRQFLTNQIPLSSFRISLWPWDEADSRPGGAGLFWSPPASHQSAATVPKTRRCVPPPKKAETFRQGCASLPRPILSLCRSVQQRPDTLSVYLAWSAL